MFIIDELFADLDQPERKRVLQWACAKFMGETIHPPPPASVMQASRKGIPSKATDECVELAKEIGIVHGKDVARRFSISLSGAWQRLYACEEAGALERIAPGRYALPGFYPSAENSKDLVSALVNLGYRKHDAKDIAERTQAKAGAGATLDAMLRMALRDIATGKQKNGNGQE